MKNTKYLLLSLSLAAIAMTGCTRTVSKNIDREGHVDADHIVFPALDKAWQKQGQFPNRENLSKIKPGIDKDELYQLVGRPHFKEAQHAREWDYIFKFYQPAGDVKICQYKVVFDKHYKGQEFYWLPADCAELAKPEASQVITQVVQQAPAPVAVLPTPVVSEKINLEADALFAFDRWRLADMRPAGRQSLDELAAKLMDYQSRGDARIVITGHTDRLGDDIYNLNLSQLRAQTVREYLISRGVEAASMIAAGAGEASPVKECSDNQPRTALIDCLQPNRRVEVAVSVYAH